MFMWLVTSGKIPLPQGPLWDPKKWADEGPPLQLALFNPWKMMNADEEPVRVDVNNRTDPVGLGLLMEFKQREAITEACQLPMRFLIIRNIIYQSAKQGFPN